MQRVIVTVKRQEEVQVRDLEVPAWVEARQLTKLIAEALHWQRDQAGEPLGYEIVAEPPGRVLEPHESLAAAGAWDGAWLVFQPLGKDLPISPKSPSDTLPNSVTRPVKIWSPLVTDLPIEQTVVPESVPPKPVVFAWKPLSDAPVNLPHPEKGPESEEGAGFVWKELD